MWLIVWFSHILLTTWFLSSFLVLCFFQSPLRPLSPVGWCPSAACWTTSTGTSSSWDRETPNSTSLWTNTHRRSKPLKSSASGTSNWCVGTRKHPHKPDLNSLNPHYVQLIVGASQNPGTTRKNFQGCLENLMYNGVNVTELAKNNDQQVSIKVGKVYVYLFFKNKENKAEKKKRRC